MTTEEIIIQIFCDVDEAMPDAKKVAQAKSYPREVVTIGTKRQIGTKNPDKGRWSIGIKLCWIFSRLGTVVGWHWLPMNHPDQDFLPVVSLLKEDGVVLSDMGFRYKAGTPNTLKVYRKGNWNDRMPIETSFSLLTVVCLGQENVSSDRSPSGVALSQYRSPVQCLDWSGSPTAPRSAILTEYC